MTLVESGDPLWTPDPDVEQMKVDFRKALARLVPVFMPDLLFRVKADGTPVFPGFRRSGRADRVRAGKDLRLGQDAADRLLRRDGRRPDRAAEKSRPRHHPESGNGDGVPLPHFAVPDAPRRRLEGKGLRRDADRLGAAQRALQILGRRSARCVQELGGGRRSAQPARHRARASTSASCCASCCAAST